MHCATSAYIMLMLTNRSSQNEKHTFDAYMSWAKRSCKEESIDATKNNLRLEHNGPFSSIQFNRISQEEFIECRRSYSFFTFEEYENIINNPMTNVCVPAIGMIGSIG